MKKSKWSEQSFSEQTLKIHDNGQEIERKQKVLNVCVSGMDLYRKSFIDGQHHHSLGILSYDFIVLAGAECTKGRFYEMEYMIDKEGTVFRALLHDHRIWRHGLDYPAA